MNDTNNLGIEIVKAVGVEVNGTVWTTSTTITNRSSDSLEAIVLLEVVRRRWQLPAQAGVAGLVGNASVVISHSPRSAPYQTPYDLRAPGWDVWAYGWLTQGPKTPAVLAPNERVSYALNASRLCGTEEFAVRVYARELPTGVQSDAAPLTSEMRARINLADLIDDDAPQYKLSVAGYHVEVMEEIRNAGWLNALDEIGLERFPVPMRERALQASNRFFWHFESFLFQVMSAFQLTVQELCARKELAIADHRIGLRTLDRDDFQGDSAAALLRDARDSEWFHVMQEIRNQVAHKVRPSFEIESNESGDVRAIAVYNGRTFVPETCRLWLEYMRQVVAESCALMRSPA